MVRKGTTKKTKVARKKKSAALQRTNTSRDKSPEVKQSNTNTASQLLVREVLAGERTALARAITFLESTRLEDQHAQHEMLAALMTPHKCDTVSTKRIGVTGIPGAGKSTLIDALGLEFIRRGSRVAVLAVDPSSSISGGSILGDKTRMEHLAREDRSFIRPSPSSGMLGGVASRTREAIIAVEAAGYDVVIVETVGVGQSEIAVRDLVDVCVLVTITGAGDELQGMKRGLLELADIVAVNKADGDNHACAQALGRDLKSSFRLMTPFLEGWEVPILLTSALQPSGIEPLGDAIEDCVAHAETVGMRQSARRAQDLRWFDERLLQVLKVQFFEDKRRALRYQTLRNEIMQGVCLVPEALKEVLDFTR